MKSEEKKEIREAGKDPGTESTKVRGCSSVGRAPALQAGGHGFESHHLHCRREAPTGGHGVKVETGFANGLIAQLVRARA